ncbi:methylated-DNA--[protein]-cysteine S-methyltransferase [Enemella evansiae]|uniref:methylated-DNA--[protein]-cysteine S-methyltransferase n=1 Tax=Enemella evansiae TaxID=2016499 RepID=UPI00105C1A95|nr:methylated-DNA--[protein]-cysteine S-methyltransferase [Enemella evansiae]TDO89788.1 methylated-DNA-[protein]-cysteine S-methyltransferase [Enemella evansiae]
MTTEQEETERLAALTERFTARAEGAGLIDIAWRTIDSPIGQLLLAATEQGVVRVGFAIEGHDAVLAELAERISPRTLHGPRRLDAAAYRLDHYFTGRHDEPRVPLDLRLTRGYRAEVVRALAGIPYGATVSYAELAADTGRPRAVRAVGTACATNPLPLLLPCHRVVRSDGGTGAYRGGAEAKAYLLEMEAAHPRR